MVRKLVDIKPSRFVKAGSEIEALFYGEDGVTKEWYSGEVMKVNRYGVDDSGSYVVCHIEYSDGEVEEDATFYDKDFEYQEHVSKSEDLWRLKGSMSSLLRHMMLDASYLESMKKELEEMKRRLEDNNHKIVINLDYTEEDEDSEDDDSEDDDGKDEEYDCVCGEHGCSEEEDDGNVEEEAFDSEVEKCVSEKKHTSEQRPSFLGIVVDSTIFGFLAGVGYILGVSIAWNFGKQLSLIQPK